MGIRTSEGTDTAWTFEPSPKECGAQLLRDAGWDGQTPILAICPVNPFWWPVKPDLLEFMAHEFAGQYEQEHYKSIYFHEWSNQDREKYHRYIDNLAHATKAFLKDHQVFPILVLVIVAVFALFSSLT